MKHWIVPIILITCLIACNEQSFTQPTNTPSAESQFDSSEYQESLFSKYIFVHKTQDGKMLIKFDFFPSGTNFCEQVNDTPDCTTAKTAVIPCEFLDLGEIDSDDWLNFNINAPVQEADCANKIVIDLSQAQFTIEGLVFTYTLSVDVFATDFLFKITSTSFTDVDGTSLSFDTIEVKLDDVYNKIIELNIP